jgi:RNA polymerase sigma factor (sigma-70 family)
MRDAVRALIARYGWITLSEDELIERVLRAMRGRPPPADLERLVITEYTIALYDACCQTVNLDRRERAYTDVFNYLYRAATKRWPTMAGEVAQQALSLTFERIETCQSPITFLTFAIWQLRRAHTEILRATDQAVPLDEIDESVVQLLVDTLTGIDPECLELLAAMIRGLPERQRQTIFWKYFAGWSDAAISARTGDSLNNVRVLRNRGLERLRGDQRLREICVEA